MKNLSQREISVLFVLSAEYLDSIWESDPSSRTELLTELPEQIPYRVCHGILIISFFYILKEGFYVSSYLWWLNT